jgi:hypothetical protein
VSQHTGGIRYGFRVIGGFALLAVVVIVAVIFGA